jgi:hypothetical protein
VSDVRCQMSDVRCQMSDVSLIYLSRDEKNVQEVVSCILFSGDWRLRITTDI